MKENKMFTILTPTYNRKKLLNRVYENLKVQTDLDFKWIIVDNHSTDGTKEMIERWLLEDNPFEIQYHYHDVNVGLTRSLRELYFLADTKYVLECDDDDQYLPNMVAVHKELWLEIEKEGRGDIGSVRVLTQFSDGRIVGKISREEIGRKYDSDYIEENIIKSLNMENQTSIRLDYFKQINPFFVPDSWLGRKIMYVSECVTWINFTKQFKTRYYHIPLRIYTTTNISATRIDKTKNLMQHRINGAYSGVQIINLKSDILPYKRLLKDFCFLSVFSIQAKLPYFKVMKELNYTKHKISMFLLWPVAFCIAKYFRYVKKQVCY